MSKQLVLAAVLSAALFTNGAIAEDKPATIPATPATAEVATPAKLDTPAVDATKPASG